MYLPYLHVVRRVILRTGDEKAPLAIQFVFQLFFGFGIRVAATAALVPPVVVVAATAPVIVLLLLLPVSGGGVHGPSDSYQLA